MSDVKNGSLEKRQDLFSISLTKMSGHIADHGVILASLQTSTDGIAKQLSVLFRKGDKPTPWGVIFSGLAVIIVLVGAVITPIMSDIHELKMHKLSALKHNEDDAYRNGVQDTNIEWLKKTSDKSYNLLHLPTSRQ